MRCSRGRVRRRFAGSLRRGSRLCRVRGGGCVHIGEFAAGLLHIPVFSRVMTLGSDHRRRWRRVVGLVRRSTSTRSVNKGRGYCPGILASGLRRRRFWSFTCRRVRIGVGVSGFSRVMTLGSYHRRRWRRVPGLVWRSTSMRSVNEDRGHYPGILRL